MSGGFSPVISHVIPGQGADVVPVGGRELHIPGQYLLEQLLLVVGDEGRKAAQQDIRDHARRPHVHLGELSIFTNY